MSTDTPSGSAITRPTLLIPDAILSEMDDEQAHFISMRMRHLALANIHRDLGMALESLRVVQEAIGMEIQHLGDYISVHSPTLSDGPQKPYGSLEAVQSSTFSASSAERSEVQEACDCADRMRSPRSITNLKAVCLRIKQTLGRVAATN